MRNNISKNNFRESGAIAQMSFGKTSQHSANPVGFRSPDAFVKQASEETSTGIIGGGDTQVVQRALPHTGIADTKGYYKSQSGAKNKKYDGGRPANFSTKFKMDMVKNEWKGAYNKTTDMWYVESIGESGVVLPTNAIQIDHTVPWDTIEERLKEKPSDKLGSSDLENAKKEGYVTPSGNNYTLYAARMYYHDVENLKPWAGSENASKGKNYAATKTSKHNAMSNRVARSAGVHNEMVQAARQAFGEWGHDASDVITMMKQIDKADGAMVAAADFLNGM